MRTKKATLRNVKLQEVSLVGKGDNPEAHVLLLKTKPNQICDFEKDYKGDDKNALLKQWCSDNIDTLLKESGYTAEMFNDIIEQRELREDLWEMIWTLQDSINSIISDDSVSNKETMIATTVAQFQVAVSEKLKGGSEEMKKTVEELEKALADEQAKSAELEKKLAEEVEKAAKPAVNEDGTCKMCGAKVKKEQEIDKSALPESVRKHLEETEEKLQKQAADIAKMQEESLTKACVEKAESIAAAGATDEISKFLKDVTKLSPELAEKGFSLLKTCDARIKEAGLFKEAGKTGDSTVKTAAEQLDALAKEYAAKENVTYAKAYDHIYTTNHELRKAYNAER